MYKIQDERQTKKRTERENTRIYKNASQAFQKKEKINKIKINKDKSDEVVIVVSEVAVHQIRMRGIKSRVGRSSW
jgi:chemotaxis protein histidine kinase CheA